MRSLTTKLTLAFLFVSLAGALITSAFIQWRTRSEFDQFLVRQDTAQLVTALQNSYAASGSWQDCQSIIQEYADRQQQYFATQRATASDPNQGKPASNGIDRPGGEPPNVDGFRFPLTIVSADRRIICGPEDRIGALVNDSDLRQSVKIEVDGQTVGYLMTGSLGDRRRSPEEAFLRQVNGAIITSGALGLLLALVLGAILARTLTNPLRELTVAAQRIAQGELGYQVKVRSQDELGSLATAFNRMSADLNASTQARRQMTADIAHDLRTPLSLILGYTEALADGKLPGAPEIFEVMHQEANHLNRLIDDLRLISLAEAGELSLNCVRMAPATLVERAEAAFKPRAEQKGVTLQAEIAAGLPDVNVDPERMAQVLGNLIANALRYTLAGGQVTLAAERKANDIVLSVRDTGPGVDPEDLPHIFDRFYRGDKSRRAGEESGLGLTIARSLVEAQGGVISVESVPGAGAAFIIRLPVSS